jgi:predicted glycosyltransferase
MPSQERNDFLERGKKIENMKVIDFDSRLEELIFDAKAVVSMGGYNTFCEILSFDKPALIVPRTIPREEQLLRAQRAAELDMVDMLLPDDADDPMKMAKALLTLLARDKPSERVSAIKMEGLQNLSNSVEAIMQARKPG